jgi:SRSO17 transposase
MTSDQIKSLGPALTAFLGEFDDCFANADTRAHLPHYVHGQLSDLPRKIVEPMAIAAGVPPRTLQEFLSLSDWNHALLRDRVQQILARDHAEPNAIGIVDESGHPKKGNHTAAVQRQYCGNTGKIDNCVMSVHLAYASWDNDFRTMADADLYLPASWDGTGNPGAQRRRGAQVPDDVHYRPKYDIALEQLRRARANGLHLAWVTADEWYGGKPAFIAGLEQMAQPFVLEVPRNLSGWSHEPANTDTPRSKVEDLCRHSPAFTGRNWKRFHVKDTTRGPMVWEARAAALWMERDGAVVGPYRLVVARDVLDPDEVKFFLSDATDVPLRTTLHVAFSRWPVERCLQDQKTELGLSHFECRKYDAVLRHLLLTQVSQLFLARQARRLNAERGKKRRGEKRRGTAGDGVPGPHRRRRPDRCAAAGPCRPRPSNRPGGRGDPSDPTAQRRGAGVAHKNPPPPAARDRHPRRAPHVLRPTVTVIAL